MNTSNSAKQEALDFVRAKLQWMRSEHIWPNGLRYLWTDAFGVVLLVSLFEELDDDSYLDGAAWLIADVQRVLGRQRGIRIGEEPDRDGQYFHYLAMWRGVPLNTSREPRCWPDRWRDATRAEGNGCRSDFSREPGLRYSRLKPLPHLAATRRAVAQSALGGSIAVVPGAD